MQHRASGFSGQMPGSVQIDEQTYRRIETLGATELDALPFGIIQLDEQGYIRRYNTYEANLAKVRPDDVLGRHFFREVAPCTDVQEFHGRFLEGVSARSLDVKFRYHFPFKDGPRDVLVTLFYSAATRSVFVLVQPVG